MSEIIYRPVGIVGEPKGSKRDIISLYIDGHATHKPGGQDPEVIKRCPDAVRNALKLIFRFNADNEELMSREPNTLYPLRSPVIGYETSHSNEGYIWLTTAATPNDVRELRGINPKPDTEIKLFASADHTQTDKMSSPLYRITPTGMESQIFGENLVVANLEDLKHFEEKVADIKAAAFPSNKL